MAGMASRKWRGLELTTKSYAKSVICATSANLRCIIRVRVAMPARLTCCIAPNFRSQCRRWGHEPPRLQRAVAAERPLIPDTKADDRRGRNEPSPDLRFRLLVTALLRHTSARTRTGTTSRHRSVSRSPLPQNATRLAARNNNCVRRQSQRSDIHRHTVYYHL